MLAQILSCHLQQLHCRANQAIALAPATNVEASETSHQSFVGGLTPSAAIPATETTGEQDCNAGYGAK